MGRVLSILAAIMLSAAAVSAAAVDYSDPSSWAYFGIGEGKEADLFIICPTVDMGLDGEDNMDMDDEKTRASFTGALNMERGIYEDECTMYAPFYRQMTFPVFAEERSTEGPWLDIAYEDISAAFAYYMENLNDGRPIILAGFSQGAQLALMLLEEYSAVPGFLDSLIAAYCMGWRVTEDYLASNPALRMAEGECDTGVIVSFNTESPGTRDSIIVPEGVRTAGINPLSWRCDSTPAGKEECIGACFTDYSGSVVSEIPYLTGAYLDPERGTLKAVDIDPDDYTGPLFPDGVYHLYDYQFFFRNLEENVSRRTEAWLLSHE